CGFLSNTHICIAIELSPLAIWTNIQRSYGILLTLLNRWEWFLDLPTLAASKPGLTSLARWVSCSWLRESLSDGLRFILSANTSLERSFSKLIIDSSELCFIYIIYR